MASDDETTKMDTSPVEPPVASTSHQEPEKPKLKRNILVNPDDPQEELVDAKRPKMQLDPDQKVSCLQIIINSYLKVINLLATKDLTVAVADLKLNVNLGNGILSILFACHNLLRHQANGVVSNLTKKSKETSFKLMLNRKEIALTRAEVSTIWEAEVKLKGFVYEKSDVNKGNSWYGTMGPYLDFFGDFNLRVTELRLGHANVPVTKEDGDTKSFPVSKYGLDGAHHILLEGCTFPPERRSSMVQSLGPMTAFLCMLRTEGRYRNKYESAVKRCMSHIPCIDDIIKLTKNTKKAADISIVTRLIADILLITTARQATRIFVPLNMFVHAYAKVPAADRRSFLLYYSTTGAGGFYTYKLLEGIKFVYRTQMTEEMISQVVFHGIFGTFKEDLGLLAEITNNANWFSREDMGKLFQAATASGSNRQFSLPKLNYYSKMACANQTGMLTGVFNQVTTHSSFSGKKTHTFGDDFFSHLEKRTNQTTSAKSLNQIIAVLSSTLDDLLKKLSSINNKIVIGTTSWRKTEDLGLDKPGSEVETTFRNNGRMFMGRKK